MDSAVEAAAMFRSDAEMIAPPGPAGLDVFVGQVWSFGHSKNGYPMTLWQYFGE